MADYRKNSKMEYSRDSEKAKFILLYQNFLEYSTRFFQLLYLKKGSKFMKFEDIFEQNSIPFQFGVEFFIKDEKIKYRTFINGERDKDRNIIEFEKELEREDEYSLLFKEVKENVLKIGRKITDNLQISFIEAVKFIFRMDKPPLDVELTGELTMKPDFTGFEIKDSEYDNNEIDISKIKFSLNK